MSLALSKSNCVHTLKLKPIMIITSLFLSLSQHVWRHKMFEIIFFTKNSLFFRFLKNFLFFYSLEKSTRKKIIVPKKTFQIIFFYNFGFKKLSFQALKIPLQKSIRSLSGSWISWIVLFKSKQLIGTLEACWSTLSTGSHLKDSLGGVGLLKNNEN